MYTLGRYFRSVNRSVEIFKAVKQLSPYLGLTLEYLDLKRIEYPVDVHLEGGIKLCLEEAEEVKILWNIFVRRCYRVAGDESVILDLGGNIGLFSLYASREAPSARIFTAEPMPATFARLEQNLRRNGLQDRVTALNYAVAGTECERFFAREAVPSGQRRLLSGPDDETAPDTRVSCRTLTWLLEENRLQKVDLAKIDIEGSEFESLLATPPEILRRIQRISLELHNNTTAKGYQTEDLLGHLRNSNFEVTQMATDPEGFSQVELRQK
jgi:FkbM family methyltransferase